MEELVSKFSTRLEEMIADKDITAYRLSKATGVPRDYISRYISGKCIPKREIIEKFADFFEVSEQWLLGYNVPKEADFILSKSIIIEVPDFYSFEYKKDLKNFFNKLILRPDLIERIKNAMDL